MKIKISNKELIEELVGKKREFPKYATQLINLASRTAQATRPRVVGQMTELIKECPEKTYEGWKKWYLAGHPDTIKNAIDKVSDMINKLKEALMKIDRKMIKSWVENLVLEQTYIGLRFQEAILKKIAQLKGASYRMALESEEHKGIDGMVGNTSYSVKPETYKTQKHLIEDIKADNMVFYKKTKSGVEFEIEPKD